MSVLFPDINEKYVDPNKRIANDGGKSSNSGGGGKGLLSLDPFNNPFTVESRPGFKTLIEQANHDMNKGSFAYALSYLNKAISVFFLLKLDFR